MSENVKVVLEVSETPGGAKQVSIGVQDAEGYGHGYRLAGPKFRGDSKLLVTRELDARDVEEIRLYLRLWDEIQARKVAAA